MTNTEQGVSRKKETTISVVLVGCIGAVITYIRDTAVEHTLIPAALLESSRMMIPIAAMGIYVVGKWIWDAIRPQSAEVIRDRRAYKKAIAECDKELLSSTLTDDVREDLLRIRADYVKGKIQTLVREE